MTILLVEDDPGIARFVIRGLEPEDYRIEWVQTAAEGLAALCARPYAAAVLDVGLPDGDGLDLCRQARDAGVETPVLMLTARETLNDKLDGFRSGADDYLTKPFAFEELLARLTVLTRRGEALSAQIVTAGALRLDLKSRTAACDGTDMPLSNREFDLLACLAQTGDDPVSRQSLLDKVWGVDSELTENTVDVYIGYLRKHLADQPAAPRIETVRGVGFRLAPRRAAT